MLAAAWQEDKRFAEAALRAGADPNEARRQADPERARTLGTGRTGAVEPGARRESERGRCARLDGAAQAVSRGNERLVSALLAAGGDSRREDAEGITPFEMAVAKGKPKLIRLFR